MTQDKIIKALNLAINALKDAAGRLETHNDLYLSAIQGCYDALNAEVNKPTASQSEAVGMKLKQEDYHSIGYDKKGGQFVWWAEIPFGAMLYTKPQPTSQYTEKGK